MKTLVTIHSKDDAYLFTHQIPALPKFTTLVFRNGTGGYHSNRDDGKPQSPRDITTDEKLLWIIQASFKNGYRSVTGKEWGWNFGSITTTLAY